MEQDNKSSILAFIIALPLIFVLLMSSVSAQKLYTGGEKYEKDGVVALLLHLNGKMIEWVYKENLAQCLKSKRIDDGEEGRFRKFSYKLIEDNNYSFLFKSSLKTIANRTADYSIENFSENKNAIIFYENNYQDSLVASLYQQKLDSNDFNIIYSQPVSLEDSRLILDSLASTYEFILSDSLFDTLSNVSDIIIKEGRCIDDLDTTYMYTEKFLIEDDSIGHIFISSKNSLFASNAISALDIRNDTIPLIGYSEWLDYNVISVDQFQDIDVRMIGTTFFE